MTILIEHVRTVILVRDRRGCYRVLYFSPMPAGRALALLPEYGVAEDEVVSVETCAIESAVTLRDGQMVPKLLSAFETSPFVLGGGKALSRRAADEWVEKTLQSMLPPGTTLGPLPRNLMREIYTSINERYLAL